MRRALSLSLSLLWLVVLTGSASAQDPIDRALVLPPGLNELQRTPTGPSDLFVREGWADRSSVVAEATVVPDRGTDDLRRPFLVWMRGTRFVTEQAAEAAALALHRAVAEEAMSVTALGTLGDGFIATFLTNEIAGLDDAPRLYVHDAWRVRGHDLFLVTAATTDDAAVPDVLSDAVRRHAAQFPGSTTPLPAVSSSRLPRVLAGLAVVALLAAGWWWVRRPRATPPPRSAPPPPSGGGSITVHW